MTKTIQVIDTDYFESRKAAFCHVAAVLGNDTIYQITKIHEFEYKLEIYEELDYFQ